MEIERKFLVGSIDEIGVDLSVCAKKRYEQAYISTDPTIRLRNEGGKLVLCVKSAVSASGLSREEFELALTNKQFDNLWRKAETPPVIKDRCFVPFDALCGRLTAEIDIYHGELSGLVTIEVEFADEQAAREFVPPDWFGKHVTDVTSDSRYKNSSLAVFGLPLYSKRLSQ